MADSCYHLVVWQPGADAPQERAFEHVNDLREYLSALLDACAKSYDRTATRVYMYYGTALKLEGNPRELVNAEGLRYPLTKYRADEDDPRRLLPPPRGGEAGDDADYG